jgi:hypothetical protein
MRGKKACMVCGRERDGNDIEEDHVIRAMRWFKEHVSRNAKGYRIVVCRECMPEYRRLRSRFVRRRSIYVGLGIVFTLTILVVSGGRYLGVVAYGIAITLFLYLLSLVSYVPELRRGSGPDTAKSRR